MNHTAQFTITRDDQEIDLEIEYRTSRFYPAQTYGPPEDCYPAEGGEIETMTAYVDNKKFPLTDAETEQVEKYLYENTDYSE